MSVDLPLESRCLVAFHRPRTGAPYTRLSRTPFAPVINYSLKHPLNLVTLKLAPDASLQATTRAYQGIEGLQEMTFVTFRLTKVFMPETEMGASGTTTCGGCRAGVGMREAFVLQIHRDRVQNETAELLMHIIRRVTPTGVIQLGLDVRDESVEGPLGVVIVDGRHTLPGRRLCAH